MTMRALFRTRPAFFLAFYIFLAGCTPMGIQPDQADTPEGALAIAESAGYSDTALRGLLSTASRYQDADRHRDARTVLQSDALAQNVAGDTLHQYRLLAMASIVALDDRNWAASFAQELPIDQFSNYPQDRQARAIELQAETFELAGDYLSAAQTLIASAPQDGEITVAENDRIWQLLKRTPTPRLNQAASTAIGYEQQGWLELALSLRQPGLSLDAQGTAVRAWQRNWQDHSATNPLPSELRLIVSLSEERPEHVALALPLSGPLADVGRAIRDGYFAAFYSDPNRGSEEKLRIDVYDTQNQDFPALYQEIIRTSPDLVVGPLEKKALNAIAEQGSLNTPLLALNYLDETSQPPAQLYQ